VVSHISQKTSEMWGTLSLVAEPRAIQFKSWIEEKRSLGFAHRFRPTYAWANVGHPSFPVRLR
jgi:hypothetical protein